MPQRDAPATKGQIMTDTQALPAAQPAPKIRGRRMRSRAVRLALLGAATFSVASCREERVEASAFPNVEECRAAAAEPTSWMSADECDAAFAEALALHEETAPRYDDQQLCEEEHGGECMVQQHSDGSSIFMPLMMGYLLGNMLGGRSAARTQPIYGTKTGGFSTAAGTAVSSNRGTGQFGANSFRSAPSTATAAPMPRASVARSGGFGAARTSGATRSFGG